MTGTLQLPARAKVRITLALMPWLNAMEIFALPSWGEEGVPQAILQAMACAIPVVSIVTADGMTAE